MENKKKKIYREEESALVAGVFGGLAEYFKQDPVLFRLAGVTLLVVTGVFPGLLLYIIAWLIMPGRPQVDYVINEK